MIAVCTCGHDKDSHWGGSSWCLVNKISWSKKNECKCAYFKWAYQTWGSRKKQTKKNIKQNVWIGDSTRKQINEETNKLLNNINNKLGK